MATIERALDSGTWVEHRHLAIRIERDPEELFVVEFYGEFDLAGSDVAERELRRAGDSDARKIIVDLSGLDFIDSRGLHVLHQASAGARRGRLRFLRGPAPVDRLFKLTGLDKVLPFAD